MTNNSSAHPLNIIVGELVEVRSREEILSTLDQNGKLDAMPFMPEMLQYCGKRFRIFKRADKTCDNIRDWSLRRVKNAVHLAGVRCDGSSHADCDAGCLLFWNERWLKAVDPQFVNTSRISEVHPSSLETPTPAAVPKGCSEQRLRDAVFRPDQSNGRAHTLYTC